MPLPPLSEWETFYVIIGSSAGALTGLMFVVVALGAESRVEKIEGGVRAFGTPTVAHFCAVLLLAAIVSIPRHTISSLTWCLSAVGLGGLALLSWVVVQTRRQQAYAPVLSDWIWHVGLPFASYGSLLAAGIALSRRPAPALDVVAVAALLLLLIGIHNAWDAAVWIASRRR